jgi:uncharacterized membrane protein HdeD (DUF308 family)
MFTKADIEKYFIAEKQESWVFMILGLLAIVVALFFIFYYKSSFAKGLAIPLILVGIAHIVVGYTVFSKSDKQRTDNVYCYDLDQAKLKNNEVPRMEEVMKNFFIYRWSEIGLAIVGLLLILFFRTNPDKALWYGLGVGLTIEALASLILDFFAEKRGWEYLDGLKSFLKM